MSAYRFFKPKGLTIYVRDTGQRNSITGGPALIYHGAIKSKGRTGASVRSKFARAYEGVRQRALRDWLNDHSTEWLT